MGKLERFDTLPAFTKMNAEDVRDGASTDLPKWSATFDPPAVGDTIRLKINSIGLAVVVGYATLDGWLGVMTVPMDPPEWWVKQNGPPSNARPALAFGIEIGLLS